MNRLHPEDLRALIAGMHQAHDSLDPIGSADALLAELAKTAKPAQTPTIEEVTEGRTVTVYPCPKCGETDPEAKPDAMTFQLERDMLAWRQKTWENATRAEKAEARVKELESRNAQLLVLNAGLEDTANALAQTGTELEIRVKELEAALQTASSDSARVKKLEPKP